MGLVCGIIHPRFGCNAIADLPVTEGGTGCLAVACVTERCASNLGKCVCVIEHLSFQARLVRPQTGVLFWQLLAPNKSINFE